MKKQLIELRINGRTHELAIEPSDLLLDVLRQDLQLTGSKRGCDDSSCGACTVLIDGVPTLSCTALAMSFAQDEQGRGGQNGSEHRMPSVTLVTGRIVHLSLHSTPNGLGCEAHLCG